MTVWTILYKLQECHKKLKAADSAIAHTLGISLKDISNQKLSIDCRYLLEIMLFSLSYN